MSLTVSPEAARGLEVAGWNKKTYFVVVGENIVALQSALYANEDFIYAPMIGEIIDELPEEIEDGLGKLTISLNSVFYMERIAGTLNFRFLKPIFRRKNIADALAKMWIFRTALNSQSSSLSIKTSLCRTSVRTYQADHYGSF